MAAGLCRQQNTEQDIAPGAYPVCCDPIIGKTDPTSRVCTQVPAAQLASALLHTGEVLLKPQPTPDH